MIVSNSTFNDFRFAWSKLRPLLVHKLDSVMKEFYERDPTDNLGPCPNVQNIKFEEMRERLLLIINEFTGFVKQFTLPPHPLDQPEKFPVVPQNGLNNTYFTYLYIEVSGYNI